MIEIGFNIQIAEVEKTLFGDGTYKDYEIINSEVKNE